MNSTPYETNADNAKKQVFLTNAASIVTNHPVGKPVMVATVALVGYVAATGIANIYREKETAARLSSISQQAVNGFVAGIDTITGDGAFIEVATNDSVPLQEVRRQIIADSEEKRKKTNQLAALMVLSAGVISSGVAALKFLRNPGFSKEPQ